MLCRRQRRARSRREAGSSICDAEFDDENGRICSLITPGKAKFFGLLGREDDYILPWECIVRVGRDIILVDSKEEMRRCKRPRRF